MHHMKNHLATASCVFLLASATQAQFTLSELLINSPGADQGLEGIEIRGTPGASLNGYKVLVIEGDRGATSQGFLDKIIDLNGYVIGPNGLALVRDVPGLPYFPVVDAATNVYYQDFVPDIENSANTFVLGFGTVPPINTDLDANDDNDIDVGVLPGFTAVDAVSYEAPLDDPATGGYYCIDSTTPTAPRAAGPRWTSTVSPVPPSRSIRWSSTARSRPRSSSTSASSTRSSRPTRTSTVAAMTATTARRSPTPARPTAMATASATRATR
jgi:hypothetical protein